VLLPGFLGSGVFFEKHGGGCMITFGWGLEQGLFFGTSKLLACLQPNDDDFGILFFGLRTYPMLTTYLTVVLFFSTWQLSFYLLEADLPCG